MKYVGDWYMWFSIFEKTEVAYIHQTLNYFRQHQNTTRGSSKGIQKKTKEHYTALIEFKNRINPIYNQEELELRLVGIYNSWNIALKEIFESMNIELIKLAFKIDKKIFIRILKSFFNKVIG